MAAASQPRLRAGSNGPCKDVSKLRQERLGDSGSFVIREWQAVCLWFVNRMKLKQHLFSTRPDGGFSLVETLVSMAVVGVVFAALYTGMTYGFFNMQGARESVRATQIMQEKLEMIRLYSWDKITQPGFVPANSIVSYTPPSLSSLFGTTSTGVTYQCSISIANAPLTESYSTNMRLITATLTWNTGGLQRQRQMTTLVAKNALQSYIN